MGPPTPTGDPPRGRAPRAPVPGAVAGVSVARGWALTCGVALVVGGLAAGSGRWTAAPLVALAAGLVLTALAGGRWRGRWLSRVLALRMRARKGHPYPPTVGGARRDTVTGPDGSPLAVTVRGGRAALAGDVVPLGGPAGSRFDLAGALRAVDGRRGSPTLVRVEIRTEPAADGAVLRRDLRVELVVDGVLDGVPDGARLPAAALARLALAAGPGVTVLGEPGPPAELPAEPPAAPAGVPADGPAGGSGGAAGPPGWAAATPAGDGWAVHHLARRLPRSAPTVAAAVEALATVPVAAVAVTVTARWTAQRGTATTVATRLADPDRSRLEAGVADLAARARRNGVHLVRQDGAHGTPDGAPDGVDTAPEEGRTATAPALLVDLTGPAHVSADAGGVPVGREPATGVPVLVPLAGPGDGRARVAAVVGDLALAARLAEAAGRPGSPVTVATARPQAWAGRRVRTVPLPAASDADGPPGGVLVWDGGAVPDPPPSTGPSLVLVVLPFVHPDAAGLVAAADAVLVQRPSPATAARVAAATGLAAADGAALAALADAADTEAAGTDAAGNAALVVDGRLRPVRTAGVGGATPS